MSADKIVRMANDIAKFMESKPHAEGVSMLASHINDFWEPRMRRQLFQKIDAGEAGLRPLVLEAAGAIRRPPAEEAA
jgi:formate dehydrogenase subunit delta